MPVTTGLSAWLQRIPWQSGSNPAALEKRKPEVGQKSSRQFPGTTMPKHERWEGTERQGYCKFCREWYHITKFRIKDNYYREKCNICRGKRSKVLRLKKKRARDRAKLRAKENEKHRLATLMHKGITGLSSTDALIKLVDRFCDEAKLTPGELVTTLVNLATDKECEPAERRRIASTILHINAIAELAKAQAGPNLDNPDKVIRELHRTHQLLPTLRNMFTKCELSFDDIDPPPVDIT